MIEQVSREEKYFALDEILTGLSLTQKQISPKYFYDEKGSELFEKICGLKVYYLTRAETEIIEKNAAEICYAMEPDSVLYELGSGASSKTRFILNHAPGLAAYVPVDISKDALIKSVEQLLQLYPETPIYPVCADLHRLKDLPTFFDWRKPRRGMLFFGSTLGNFNPLDAAKLLKQARSFLGEGGWLLVGVDLKKDRSTLEAAYNDSQGVTAAFNLNILGRLNREFDADFDLRKFKHHAFYAPSKGRIEMHLVSLKDQTVRVAGHRFEFKEGETIHTENSYKYSPEEAELLFLNSGFTLKRVMTDSRRYFNVYLLEGDRAE